MLKVSPTSAPVESVERPLSGVAKLSLIARAALAILWFYIFAAGAILFLLLLLGVEVIAAGIGARFGLFALMAQVIKRHWPLVPLFARSFWIPKGAEFRVPVEQADAPELFAILQRLAARMAIAAPKKVVIEMSAGAWVRLGGFRRGAKETTLGLGYDLLAGLAEREVEAVLAHEMAHARLVRRGLKRWLVGGVNRAAKLTNGLAAHIGAYRHAKVEFQLGEWLLARANRTTLLAARLVAGYSRQDEFEADRGAAEICGTAPLRSSLLKLERIEAKTARIGWNERVAQLQRGEGFASWLVEELGGPEVAPDEAKAGEASDRFSTHPSLHDRIAALPPDAGPAAPSQPAIHLFTRPDEVAARLVTEIQRVAAFEEKRDDREQRRWLRRTQRGWHLRPLQLLGVLLGGAGLLILALLIDGYDLGTLVGGAALAVGGVAAFRIGSYRERHLLPVPDFVALQAAWERTIDGEAQKARQKEAETALEKRLADVSGKAPRRKFLITEAYTALGRCDYLEAHVAARRCLDVDGKCVEAPLALAIASAAFHQKEQAANLLRAVHRLVGLKARSSVWGAGWALFLIGDWPAAEAMCARAMQRDPDQPTLAALMAICQSRRNKVQSGISNARRALSAAPREPERILLLLDLLLQGGYLREAQQLMAGADTLVRTNADLTVATIRMHLLRRDFESAARWTDELKEHGLGPRHALALGAAHEKARRDVQAAAFFELARERGFYPEAHLGLARLAIHRGDKATAREHLLTALNTSRDVGPEGRTALEVFFSTVSLLGQLQEPMVRAEAWVATVTGNAVAGPLASHAFLIFAAGHREALEHFQTVAQAMRPDKPPLLPGHISWSPALQDQQPVGHVRPGIQRVWRA